MSNFELLKKYMRLKQPDDKVQLNYLWIGKGNCLRGKTKTVSFVPTQPEQVPCWMCCDIATVPAGFAEYHLKPVALYDDPLREGRNKIVLCELGDIFNKPLVYNKRHSCLRAFNECPDQCDPWLQVTQTYSLLDSADDHTLRRPKYEYPKPQSNYYCGVGTGKMFGRDIVETHCRACLHAGVSISAANAHLVPSMWQFQLGYASCVAVIDDLWITRFLLIRIAENYGVKVSFDENTIPEVTNYKSLYINFSTKQMREKDGFRFNKIVSEKNCDRHKFSLSFDDSSVVNKSEEHKDLKSKLDSIKDTDVNENNRTAFEQLSEECGFVRFCGSDSIFDPYEITNSIVKKVCLNQ